ncbi:ABC transporter transmembrane domain-containing protein [Streptomyces mobaraensis]|uniref:ABC transporter ATP-binding protein n=1 Tax=Streptomyces mobaraensis TaxID=35621 RepID=A0A5N5WA16_STRMB|nr:ABC transporter ATP-binding protein [Streptomyces mobaraensis]KAB7845567.1 ABC transporter ATP-binding protein [Streptomyces mobaraensis]
MRIRDLPYADPGVPDTRSGPRLLLWLSRRQLGGQSAALGWGVLHMAAVALFPLPLGMAVQAVVDRSGSRLALAGGLMLLLGALTALGDTMLHRVSVANWITSAARLQQLLARKAAELGSALTRRVAAGEIVTVSTADVEHIGWFVETQSRFLSAAVTTLAVCASLVFYQPVLGTVVAVGVPLLVLAVLPLLPPATRRADEQRELAGHAAELASDTVAGLRVLRGIGGEELFLARYRRASQEVRGAAVRSARMWALIAAAQVLLPGLLMIAVVWIGVGLVRDGRVGVGELVTVYGVVTFLLFPLRQFEEAAMAYSFSRPSADRAARLLALRRTVEPAGAGAGRVPVGDLRDPVTGLRARAGELTAVVCGDPDAAGLLADRLGGHAPEAAAGTPSVLLGGVALDEVPQAAAREAVLVQDKDPVLLSGTLAELLDVPSSGRVSPEAALAAACCGDVLDSLERSSADRSAGAMAGYITERGRSLSGGQRQRLALARSLLADPEVLVLDEPTSAVDAHTEARVGEGVRALREGRTTVVFTTSPLLLDRADRVVMVRDGQVVAVGRHDELLRTDRAYRATVTRAADEGAGAPDPVLTEAGRRRAESASANGRIEDSA